MTQNNLPHIIKLLHLQRAKPPPGRGGHPAISIAKALFMLLAASFNVLHPPSGPERPR
jgi:hypothetical protein